MVHFKLVNAQRPAIRPWENECLEEYSVHSSRLLFQNFSILFFFGAEFSLFYVCGEVGFWATVPGKLAKKNKCPNKKKTDTQCMVWFTFIYPLNYPNVGKYTIHWVFGIGFHPCFVFCFFVPSQDLQVIGFLATSHEISRGAVHDPLPWVVFGGHKKQKDRRVWGFYERNDIPWDDWYTWHTRWKHIIVLVFQFVWSNSITILLGSW